MFAAKIQPMHFVDTHTHLYQSVFKDDIDQVLKRAQDNGVTTFLLPNIDSDSIKPMCNLAHRYPESCFPMMGLHPTAVNDTYKDELKVIEKELLQNNDIYIAVGEIGIDLYWDKTYHENQINAFKYQINLAKELKLPIVIHARDSFDEIFSVLDEVNDHFLQGVFHSFSGTIEQAMQAMSYDFFLGIGGIVTFKNAGLDKVVQHIPMEKVILETDSPYLTPAPNRGKRNESSNLRLIADKISEIKNISVEDVASVTTANARKLFSLKQDD